MTDLVSIVVRAWGNVELTDKCLASILAHTSPELYHLILVDQLGEWSASRGPHEVPSWTVVRTPENLGAVRATNIGLQLAMLDGSEYVLVLDNDVEVPEGDVKWLERWVQHFKDDESLGAVGATTDYVSSYQNVQVTPRTYVKEVVESVEGGPGMAGPFYVDYLISFAVMLRKSAMWRTMPGWIGEKELKQVVSLDPARRLMAAAQMDRNGSAPIPYLWDERFSPGNFEDIDISIRLTLAGFNLGIARDVYLHHVGSQAFNKIGLNELVKTNLEKGLKKWGTDVLERAGIVRRA